MPQTSLSATGSPLSALRNERDRFVALAFCWADLLLELDGEGRVVYATGAFDAFLGCSGDDVAGKSFDTLVAPAERQTFLDLLATARRRERIDSASIRLVGVNGTTPPLSIVGYQLQDLNGHFFLALRYSQANRRPTGFGRRARDEATGLLDGNSFIDMVTGQIASGASEEDRCLSLIVLPRFQELQSRLVEAAEKQLLSSIGNCLQENAVDGEGAARLGPDRYGLVHRPGLDLDDLRGRIAGLTEEVDPLSQGSPVEAATIEMDHAAIGDEKAANGLVYALNRFRHSKASDRLLDNWNHSISTLAEAAMTEIGRLREMITRGDFELSFQPVLNARTGVVLYHEALCRIPPHYGVDSIYDQVTFAEETGLISAFDLAVLQKLLRWMQANTARNAKSCFGINVSGYSVGSLSYLAQVDRLLKANPWLRGRLVFEITESARITDFDSADSFIQRLRQQGFKVALDDFGAGAANFEYLSRLEVDTIKFDGSALNAATKVRQGKAFIKALVAFSRELGVSTVAEMVEDEGALDFARGCGVQFVQGFLFGQPGTDLRTIQDNLPNHVFPERMKLNTAAGRR